MRVVGSVEINQPASKVWAYLADYGNDPSRRAAVTQMRPSVPGDHQEGVDPRGRSCPLNYRYQPEALAQPAELEADTLYVVVDLAGMLGLAQATVSGHLACLRDCGLVTWRPVGRQSYYRPAAPELEALLRAAEQVLARTGDAVELCPNYGTAATTPAPAGPSNDAG